MARDARPAGLSRRHRFSTRGSFAPALRSARKIRGQFAVLHFASRAAPPARLGIALTRRLAPRAVDRNRFKRIVRETFRRHPVKALALDCVVALRAPFAGAGARAAKAEVAGLFDQLCGTAR